MDASPSPEARHSVGIDVVSVDRLRHLLLQDPSAADQLFTPAETAYAVAQRRPEDHLAARFAGKEAVLKALGIGLLDGVDWTDVEVANAPDGHPVVRLTGNAQQCADRNGLRQLEISLTHSGGIAMAQVLAVFGAPSCT